VAAILQAAGPVIRLAAGGRVCVRFLVLGVTFVAGIFDELLILATMSTPKPVGPRTTRPHGSRTEYRQERQKIEMEVRSVVTGSTGAEGSYSFDDCATPIVTPS
jgi:hypothetical protein